MPVDQTILDRFDELVNKADAIAATRKSPGRGVIMEDWVDLEAFTEWIVSCLAVVARVAGRQSEHYQTIAASRDRANWWSSFARARAALKAARDDYAGGWLVDFKELAAGEVFTDFLDMAQYLCDKGYHMPAASLAGAVLEDALRRLHLKHIGQWTGDSRISKLNDVLHKAQVYPKPQWHQIQTWGAIRNEADHGNFDNVDPQSIPGMIAGMRDFVARYSS